MDEQELSGESGSGQGGLWAGDWSDRSAVERRSGLDQRSTGGGKRPPKKNRERRKDDGERRRTEERREGWLRVDQWRSVSVFDEVTAPKERFDAYDPGTQCCKNRRSGQ